ncbi:MAG: cation:proton antiporter [Nitrososphaerales archaeon]
MALPSIELIIAALLGIMVLASFLSIRAKLPYTLILVFLGVALAASSISIFLQSGPIYQIFIQNGLLVGLVVPPLIFEAMLHIRSADLKAVINPSIALATIGVVIATVVGGIVLWKFVGLSPEVSFLFAAIIAPTDAATVLEVFKRAHVPSRLRALMDTEAAFNDATAVVVFSIVLASITVSGVSLLSSVASFALNVGGGLVVGLGVGFAAEIISSVISDRVSVTILTISAVYGSYALAVAFGFSGLIAVAIVGLYFGNFTVRTAMSPAARESAILFWEIAAFLANSIAFLSIGLSTSAFEFTESTIYTILVALIAVTLARAASVYPILWFFNRLGNSIPRKWRNVAMLGGMRGALSIALAASLTASFPAASSVQTMVLGVAFISLSVQAAIMSRYIKSRFKEEQGLQVEKFNVRLSKAVAAIESLQKLREQGKVSDEEFADELERDKDELREVLGDIRSTLGPAEIMKTRAAELYSALISLPMSKAMHILRINRMETPIQTIIESTTSEAREPEKTAPDAETKPEGDLPK